MRLILVLLVLLYVTLSVNGNLTSSCKQLCSDKKSCCSSPINNEYYLKTMECNKSTTCGKNLECSKLKNFAGSKYFGCGSVVTICSVGDISPPTKQGKVVSVDEDDDVSEYEEKVFIESLLGDSGSGSSALSGSSAYASASADVGLAVSSVTGELSSDMAAAMGSIMGGDDGDDGDFDDDEAFGKGLLGGTSKSYRGGNGKAGSEIVSKHHGGKTSIPPHYSSATADVGMSVSSITGELSSDMAAAVGSISSGDDGDYDDDDDGARLAKGLLGGSSRSYRGGNGKPLQKHAKCIKVFTIDSQTDFSFDSNQKIEKPIVGVSKSICKKLLGSESSCESIENQKTITVVQSTKNDGFPNKGTFYTTHEEYNLIIKHGKLLRKQCELKGKCQFNRA